MLLILTCNAVYYDCCNLDGDEGCPNDDCDDCSTDPTDDNYYDECEADIILTVVYLLILCVINGCNNAVITTDKHVTKQLFLYLHVPYINRSFSHLFHINLSFFLLSDTLGLFQRAKRKLLHPLVPHGKSPFVPAPAYSDYTGAFGDQSIQDCHNMIKGTHVHSKSNLVTLCKQCHVRLHKGQIEIFGYKSTNARNET
jgi:hypothetical protein